MGCGRRSLLVLLCLACAPGCGDDPRALAWQFRFADPDLASATARVQARVLEGGCSGRERYVQSWPTGRSEEAPMPRALATGEWGFELTARADDCSIIGYGCEDLTLPLASGSVVLVTIGPEAPFPACTPGQGCRAGLCGGGGGDGGVGGPDAGTPGCGEACAAGPCARGTIDCSGADPVCVPRSRLPDGEPCGAEVLQDWSACDYTDDCDGDAVQGRFRMRPACVAGACVVDTVRERATCTRMVDPAMCCGECGDLDGSGAVDIDDVMLLRRIAAGELSADACQRYQGDVDGVLGLSSDDAAELFEFIEGRVSSVTCGG